MHLQEPLISFASKLALETLVRGAVGKMGPSGVLFELRLGLTIEGLSACADLPHGASLHDFRACHH